MTIPKVEYGTFSVLVITALDYLQLCEVSSTLKLVNLSKPAIEIPRRLLNEHGAEVLQIYDSFVALWPCAQEHPDARVLTAAMAIVAEIGPDGPNAFGRGVVRNGLSVGCACGSVLYQRQNGRLINVLGAAIKRAEQLERLAKKRGAPLAVDSAIARLAREGTFTCVGDDSWELPSPAREGEADQ